jgi:hypothetical protein
MITLVQSVVEKRWCLRVSGEGVQKKEKALSSINAARVMITLVQNVVDKIRAKVRGQRV